MRSSTHLESAWTTEAFHAHAPDGACIPWVVDQVPGHSINRPGGIGASSDASVGCRLDTSTLVRPTAFFVQVVLLTSSAEGPCLHAAHQGGHTDLLHATLLRTLCTRR